MLLGVNIPVECEPLSIEKNGWAVFIINLSFVSAYTVRKFNYHSLIYHLSWWSRSSSANCFNWFKIFLLFINIFMIYLLFVITNQCFHYTFELFICSEMLVINYTDRYHLSMDEIFLPYLLFCFWFCSFWNQFILYKVKYRINKITSATSPNAWVPTKYRFLSICSLNKTSHSLLNCTKIVLLFIILNRVSDFIYKLWLKLVGYLKLQIFLSLCCLFLARCSLRYIHSKFRISHLTIK